MSIFCDHVCKTVCPSRALFSFSKPFFAAFAVFESEKASCFLSNLNDSHKLSHLPALCVTALYNFGIAAILLANTGKSLKFYCFESVQNLDSF